MPYTDLMGARLCFADEHGQLNYFVLGKRPTRIFGHLKTPLRLNEGEPPPNAQCRIFCKDEAWYIENVGQAGLTLVNQLPVTLLRLFHGAEIRCGPLVLDFLDGDPVPAGEPRLTGGSEVQALRQTLDDKVQELQRADSLRIEAQAEIGRLDALNAKLRAELGARHDQVESLTHKLDSLARELQVSQRSLAESTEVILVLRQQLQSARVDSERWLDERDDARQRESAAQSRARELEVATRATLADLEERDRDVQKQESELAILLQAQHELAHEREFLSRARETAVRVAREAEANLAQAQSEIQGLKQQIVRLEHKLSVGEKTPRSV